MKKKKKNYPKAMQPVTMSKGNLTQVASSSIVNVPTGISCLANEQLRFAS